MCFPQVQHRPLKLTGKDKLPDAKGFIGDNISPSTHPVGKKKDQKEMTTMDTQTVWISLDTPGSSLTDLQMEVPKELKFRSLGLKSLSLNVTMDSESEAFQKQFRSEESGIEDTEDFQIAIVKSSSVATCEFCKQLRLPFPNPLQLELTSPEKLFCCDMSWELYQQILRNQEENPDYEASVSDQDGFHPTELEVEEALKKLAERIKNPEVRMYMAPVMHGDKVIFTSTRTITFRLSSEHCMKQGWTLKPTQAKTVAFEDLTQYVPSAPSSKEAEKPCGIVERYYPDGSKFVTMFPDGTGAVFYPSGNVAIVISALRRKQLVYTIFEDLKQNAEMLGIFRSTGYGTCYLPSGQIWISITPRCGFYFTERGLLKKQWLWRDYQYHVHAPPYNSISLKLNSSISVQVVSRDRIYTTFKMRKRSIRLNMGAKLVLRDLEQADEARSDGTEPENYIDKTKRKIRVLTEQMKRL
ncbi:glutamate-rich protein 6-like isoform X2 [Mobula birostris]|uniref:glutamate-rich protein 6-like isoform X2 n=1 Tax=Mobula birostris TaxID=1983395 RepID=UPI003B2852FA